MVEMEESGPLQKSKILSLAEQQVQFTLEGNKIEDHRRALTALVEETSRGKFDGGPGPRSERVAELRGVVGDAQTAVNVARDIAYIHYEPQPFGTFTISGILTQYIPEGLYRTSVYPRITIEASRVRTPQDDREGTPTGSYHLALQGTLNGRPMSEKHTQAIVSRYLGMMKERQGLIDHPPVKEAPQPERQRGLSNIRTVFRGFRHRS